MRNFLMGGVKGLVVAGLGLGTASYLLPARVTAPSAPSAAAPETAAPEVAALETATPETAVPEADAQTAPVPPAVAEAEPAPPALPQVDLAAEPAAEANAEPTPASSEALLDPLPAQNTGAKVVTPPQPGDALQTPTISADPAPDGPLPNNPAPDTPAPDTIVPAPDAAAAVPPIGAPPLQAFAAPFAGAGGKPLFAIVLLDTGAADIDRAVWASLPLPVSFAVDPESATAAEAMALYRAAGKEVIILPTSLPAGAQASDVETSLAAYQAMLPQSVAVMSDPVSGFQDNLDLASLVVPAVGAQGRGVLLFDKGLNSAAQIAQRDGIPYAMISKMIDAGGESVPVMRRYLDRAVFKAAQDGAAVVMGQTLPDTLTALTEWSLEGRAGDVALAPISALMQPPQ